MLRTKALLIALVAASADAANLRASESRRLAGHGGHDDGELAKVREVDPHLGRGQPAAIGVAEASSRPIEAAGFPFDSFVEEASRGGHGFSQQSQQSCSSAFRCQ